MTPAAPRRRSASPRARAMRRRRRMQAAQERLGGAALGAVVAGWGVVIWCLAVIGAPPALRVDALWVRGHRGEVQATLAGLALAVAGVTLAGVVRRQRLASGAVTGLAVALIAAEFGQRVAIISRVLIEHTG